MVFVIRRLFKRDLILLKKHWNVYKPILDRYNSMKQGESIFYLVLCKNKPIGHGKLVLRTVPIIEDMYIETTMRRRGLGRKLLKRLELVAKRRKFKKTKLFVETNNKKAINLYLQESYNKTGKIVDNEFEMTKNL